MAHQFEINKKDISKIIYVEKDIPTIGDGEVLCKVDKYGFTANNVSYAVAGDTIGYWQFFPTGNDETGIIPVWGFADVIESKSDDLKIGERLYGYFPMGSHLVMTPGKVSSRNVFDMAAHRGALPPIYNQYSRVNDDPAPVKAMENERMILFPLFATSYFNYDFFETEDYYGADELIVGSASAKTSLGIAQMVHEHASRKITTHGLTSKGNVEFVKSLGFYDKVTAYENIQTIDTSKKTAFVDMSGNQGMIKSVHAHYGDQLTYSCMIGATHWDEMGDNSDVVGVKPTFFFAPGHIMKRNAELGEGVLFMKAFEAWMNMAHSTKSWMTLHNIADEKEMMAYYEASLRNEADPKVGVVVQL